METHDITDENNCTYHRSYYKALHSYCLIFICTVKLISLIMIVELVIENTVEIFKQYVHYMYCSNRFRAFVRYTTIVEEIQTKLDLIAVIHFSNLHVDDFMDIYVLHSSTVLESNYINTQSIFNAIIMIFNGLFDIMIILTKYCIVSNPKLL